MKFDTAKLNDGPALRAVLLSECRANHVTVGEWLAVGAKNYAWLAPGEARGAEGAWRCTYMYI